ncbi:MAG: EamA family transporter, partial [Syntrophothermus sp.]
MSKLRSDLILLLAAIIWGFAFVAQRIGMEFLGPFSFNGIRFTLGILVLLPFLFFRRQPAAKYDPAGKKIRIIGSLMAGLFLFGGVALQQLG